MDRDTYLAQFQSLGSPPPRGQDIERCPECGQGVYVELGGGSATDANHPNCDIQAVPGVDIVLDLERDPLPFHDNHAEQIKGIHILQHLSGQGAEWILRESYRVLRPRGVLYLMVGDLEFLCDVLLKTQPEHEEIWMSCLFHSFKPEPGGFHKWSWTRPGLDHLLTRIGFVSIVHLGPYNAWERKLVARKP